MTQTTAVEFQRKFGEFQHKALREPVEITRHGRRELVLMSADHYDWLVAAARRTHRTADAAAIVIEAVERAEMDGEHAPLDEFDGVSAGRGGAGAEARPCYPIRLPVASGGLCRPRPG